MVSLIKFFPGALVKRLKGHESNIEIFSTTDGPIFVSYGCWEEENAIKLWSIESLECIASFKLDCTASIIFTFSGLNLPIRTTIHPKISEMIFSQM